ncbi:hypothetical protein BVRB_3g060690 [Beta vulgaris subsp. vulgaris]|nr:hypothetical protein BVRB_3g060690 [Beta vulgaris subsp. vulgaris]
MLSLWLLLFAFPVLLSTIFTAKGISLFFLAAVPTEKESAGKKGL